MKITIVGGGNIGTQFAVHCAEKGHAVTVYTSQPELYDGHLNIVDDNGKTTHEGDIKQATSDPETAFRDAEYILIALPSSLMKAVANTIFEYSDSNAVIGVVPGFGGSECAFRDCIERGNVFFGIERVPAIARLIRKGRTVKSTGYRNELHIAALPRKSAGQCADFIESIFCIHCKVIPDYLNLTMTPSNPILHTTRLRSIFSDWHEGVIYGHLPLMYEEWDNASSDLLIKCDDEVQRTCRAIPEFDLQYVKSLREHYESPTAEAMTKKLSSIAAFKGLPTPSLKVEGGFVPDLHARYFTEDFSFGLSVIKQVAEFAEVETPNIDATIVWYKNIAVEKEEFRFEDYGITTREEFVRFYSR